MGIIFLILLILTIISFKFKFIVKLQKKAIAGDNLYRVIHRCLYVLLLISTIVGAICVVLNMDYPLSHLIASFSSKPDAAGDYRGISLIVGLIGMAMQLGCLGFYWLANYLFLKRKFRFVYFAINLMITIVSLALVIDRYALFKNNFIISN